MKSHNRAAAWAADVWEPEGRARFDRIIAEHASIIESLARRLCRTAADASDLVQDTYERALRHIASLQDEARARAWIVQILRNRHLDGCRRRRREVGVAEVPNAAQSEVDAAPAWQRVTAEDLHRAIDGLVEPFRSVAILHDIDGLSNEEIARRLGIPYATAATRLHRAHARVKCMLRDKLGDGGGGG